MPNLFQNIYPIGLKNITEIIIWILFRWNITYISNFFIKTLKNSSQNRIDDWIHTDAFATKGIEPDIKCRVTLNCIFMWIFLFKMCDYGSQCFHSVFMNEEKCHSSALSIQSVKIEHEVALSEPTQRSGDTCWYFVLFWVNHLTPFVNKIYALFMSFAHLRIEICIGCVTESYSTYISKVILMEQWFYGFVLIKKWFWLEMNYYFNRRPVLIRKINFESGWCVDYSKTNLFFEKVGFCGTWKNVEKIHFFSTLV